MNIQITLGQRAGVQKVDGDLNTKNITFIYDQSTIDEESIREGVTEAGFVVG